MRATDSLPETELVPRRAVPYRRVRAAWVSAQDTLPWRGTAAGGGYSTVTDLFRFAQALQSGALLDPTLLAQATRPQERRYGYGFSLAGQGVLARYGHGGGAPGMNGELRVYPRLGYVTVSLSNLDPPAATDLLDHFEARMPLDAAP